MSKFIILATRNHPFYERLKSLNHFFYDLQYDEPFEKRKSNYREVDAVFDFSLADAPKKDKFLKFLNVEFDVPILSDLTCNWADAFLKRYPSIEGSFATAFYSPTSTYEYQAKSEVIEKYLLELFGELSIKGEKIKNPGIGFNFPRIVSMIINEAYFAKEEGMNEQDIDTAMKYGVNYPIGPFEWAQKIGHEQIVNLLNELYFVTKDSRYKVSPLLQLEALKC